MAFRRSRIVLILMLVAVIASLWRAVVVEREKRRIASEYVRAQQMIQQLGTERAQLTT